MDVSTRGPALKEITAATVGFLVAPVVPALMLGLLTPVTAERLDWLTVLGLLPIGYFFSAAATIVFGVPTFLVLRRLKQVHWWSVIAAGFAIGTLVGAVVRPPAKNWMAAATDNFPTFGATGACSALVFWLVWRQGRTSTSSTHRISA